MKPSKLWFFVWTKPKDKGYVTSECSWRRATLKDSVERLIGQPWQKTYRQGGRMVQIEVAVPEQQP